MSLYKIIDQSYHEVQMVVSTNPTSGYNLSIFWDEQSYPWVQNVIQRDVISDATGIPLLLILLRLIWARTDGQHARRGQVISRFSLARSASLLIPRAIYQHYCWARVNQSVSHTLHSELGRQNWCGIMSGHHLTVMVYYRRHVAVSLFAHVRRKCDSSTNYNNSLRTDYKLTQYKLRKKPEIYNDVLLSMWHDNTYRRLS